MDTLCGETRSASIVVQVGSKEDGLIGDVCQTTLMEEVKTRNKGIVSTEQPDQRSGGMWDVAIAIGVRIGFACCNGVEL